MTHLNLTCSCLCHFNLKLKRFINKTLKPSIQFNHNIMLPYKSSHIPIDNFQIDYVSIKIHRECKINIHVIMCNFSSDSQSDPKF